MVNHPDDNVSLREKVNEVADEQRDAFYATGWWHSVDLGNGFVTPGVHQLAELQDNYARFRLPDDLRGKRLLDVGCWDGFYSFEAERHGAEVVSVDVWRPENYFKAHHALNSRATFHEMSVYELSRAALGAFDVVFFLGVLYHLRHPLLALERLCEVTREVAIIESHVMDNILDIPRPMMEFYELDELAGQFDNWWGPNSECLERMARSAGFARTEVLRRDPTRTVVRAFRHWNHPGSDAAATLRFRDIINACSLDYNFPRRGRHAYLAIFVEGLPVTASRDTVRVEVGGYGAYPVYAGTPTHATHAGCLQITIAMPPGLDEGEAPVQVFCDRQRSDERVIHLIEGRLVSDLPL